MEHRRWLIYIKERFPLPVYAIMCGGFVFSGAALSVEPLRVLPLVLSFLGVGTFFFLLRLMDELKDYQKDLVAHPERPLPRGLIRPTEVETTIRRLAMVMAFLAIAFVPVLNPSAALLFFALTVHLWLMYREFYCGEWLENRPLLYAISHQLVLIWLCAFCVVSQNGAMIASPIPFVYGFLILGSFFSYEVCRKLDPNAHPVLKTYRSLYGLGGSFLIVLCTSLIAMTAAWHLRLQWILWPSSAVLLIGYWVFARRNFKGVEALASLSLVVHLWTIVVMETFTRWL